VVSQHRPSRHICRGWPDSVAASANTGETHDAPRPNVSNRVGNHLPDARAFDDDVRLEPDFCNGTGVVAGPEGADELRLGSRIGPIENMNVQTALLPEEGSEKADRPSPGDQRSSRLPEGALAHRDDLFPGLGDDSCGLQQATEAPERTVHLHRLLRLDPPALGHEAVDLLDATLGVLTVAAHVP